MTLRGQICHLKFQRHLRRARNLRGRRGNDKNRKGSDTITLRSP